MPFQFNVFHITFAFTLILRLESVCFGVFSFAFLVEGEEKKYNRAELARYKDMLQQHQEFTLNFAKLKSQQL